MKLYGVGQLVSPGTLRVVHDFVDGPFETTNPVLIEAAIKQGFSDKPIKHKTPKQPKLNLGASK